MNVLYLLLSLFDSIFLLLSLFDGMIIGVFVFLFIGSRLGDGPLARLIKLPLGIVSGLGYAALCIYILYGDTDMSDAKAFVYLLAPIVIFLILLFITYVMDGKK